jgi:hypothetical protein
MRVEPRRTSLIASLVISVQEDEKVEDEKNGRFYEIFL